MNNIWNERIARTGRSGLFHLVVGLLLAASMALIPAAAPAAAQGPCGDTVTVVYGDTLRGIANRCDTTVEALLEANPSIVNRDLIYIGQTLQVPGSESTPAAPSVQVMPDAAPAGSYVDVFATGFAPTAEITFGIGPAGQSINTATVVTDEEGQAESSLQVPDVAPGQQLEIVASVSGAGGMMAAQASLTVTDGDQPEESTVEIAPTSGPAGTRVTVDAVGLPANTAIDIGAGRVASEYDIIARAQTNAAGELSRVVSIPRIAEAGEEWVIALTPQDSPADYISNSFSVTEEQSDDNLFTRTNIFLIALEDDGRSGMQIGCGDSVVPVEVPIEPTLGVLGAALRDLVDLDERFYGESGLYNALYRSDLTVDSVTIENGEAIVRLSGDVALGGVCDAPRFRAQLQQTALQYYTVDSVSITINGEPLDDVIR